MKSIMDMEGSWHLEFVHHIPGSSPERESVILSDGTTLKMSVERAYDLALRKISELKEEKKDLVAKGHRFDDFGVSFFCALSFKLSF